MMRWAASASLCAALFAACGNDSGVVDAIPVSPDASPDAPPTARIGDPCTRPDDLVCSEPTSRGTCAEGQVCTFAEGCADSWPGGICTRSCGGDEGACPEGSTCTLVADGLHLCLASCETHEDCRTAGVSYACALSTDLDHICRPGATCPRPPPANGGFSDNVEVPGPEGSFSQGEGNLVVDGLGHVAIAEMAFHEDSTWEVAVAVHTEGKGFLLPVAALRNPLEPTGISDPVLAYDVDAPGVPKPLHLVWMNIDRTTGEAPIMHARSLDNGATFDPPDGQRISADDADTLALDKPWIVASGGFVAVAYATYAADGATRGHVNLVVSEDGGESFSMPRRVDTACLNCYTPQVALAAATGDVFVSWRSAAFAGVHVEVARWLRSRGAAWFEPEVTIEESWDPGIPGNAVARDGSQLWAAWNHAAVVGGGVFAAVAHDVTADAPLAFTTAIRVDPEPTCGAQTLATVAIDPAGTAHVAWLEESDLGDVVAGTVRVASSIGDSSFGEPVLVSDLPFPFPTVNFIPHWLGDYMGIAATNDRLYLGWADPRSGRSHFRLASWPLR